MFDSYWWESGNPFSLIELLKKGKYYIPSLENLKTDKTLLNTFDIENLQLESLLFQAGYLTIDKVIVDEFIGSMEYTLKVPNLEIQMSLNRLIIDYLTNKVNLDTINNIRKTLLMANLEEFKNTLFSLFASIPYNNYIKNQIAKKGYWASLVYCYLAGSGVDIIAEDVTNTGRIDLTIKVNNNIYILEFKTTNEEPLKQIKEKRYYEKYLNPTSQTLNPNIYLVGITFDEESRNIKEFVWEKIEK